jgi:hypothetical protein
VCLCVRCLLQRSHRLSELASFAPLRQCAEAAGALYAVLPALRCPPAALVCSLPHAPFAPYLTHPRRHPAAVCPQVFDPKHPGVVSMVMDNWVGKGGVRDGWYWWDPKGHGAVAAGLASQILTLKTAAVVTIGTTICLIERTLDYREEKAHDRRHERRHGGH